MTSRPIPLSLAFIALSVLAACSARVDGGPLTLPQPPQKPEFKHLASGPALDGSWKSECVRDFRKANTWSVITLTFSGQSVTRNADLFSDSTCATPSGVRKEDGEFRYSKKRAESKFAVDYRFNMKNGTYEQYENFNFEGDGTLWISDEIGGEAEPHIKMTKTASDKPTPGPTPEPTPTPPQPSVITVGNHVAKYGDSIELRGQVSGVDQKEVYTNQGYDDRAKTWTVFHDISGAQSSMGYRYYNSLWSSSETTNYFANCAAKGGTSQIVTVHAGTFQTCMIDDGRRLTWYGDAPIWGIVKIENKSGNYKAELYAYGWGDSN